MNVTYFGNVIQAQTEGSLICLNDMFVAGNALRLAEGKPALQMNAFLSSKGLAEYIEAAANEWNLQKEAFLVKEGGKRGRLVKTFVHASVALLAAESMSPRFHAHIHRVFIEGKILEFRNKGGTEFKRLNYHIDRYLPNREGKENTGVYIQIAKAVREKILGEGAKTEHWNSATVEQTHMRFELENKLSDMLRVGVVRDYEHLKSLIDII